MIITTRDPITGCSIADPDAHPFVIEGEGPAALKIYFESEATRQAYLDADWNNPWEEDFDGDSF